MSTTVGEYLASLPDEVIRRAYEGLSFNADGDVSAAACLQLAARLQGVNLVISGRTLGRHRSTRGMVNHKSPRGARSAELPAPERPQTVAQPELPHVHEEGSERAGWAAVKKLDKILEGQTRVERLLEEIRDVLKAGAGLAGLDALADRAVERFGANTASTTERLGGTLSGGFSGRVPECKGGAA